LQDDYECIYCIVDLHALTTLDQTENLREHTREMVLDWLAAGIDPAKGTIVFVQSHVPMVTELHWILSTITPLGKLTDLPTFKERVRQQPHNVNYGLPGYAVLMAADITLYKADLVPVGVDQQSHLEFTREIVRTFNHRFGPVLVEPQIKLTEFPKVVGIDGQNKMSKSLDNHIELAATPAETHKRVLTMVTDPQRTHRNIPGRPEVCNVYSMHQIFSPDEVGQIYQDCTTAGIGCVDCKQIMARNLNAHLEPLRVRRADLAAQPNLVDDVLSDGAKKATAIATQVLAEVKDAVGLP
ncbi:MAG: tryptophan--tRNA ligase, partial [Anaerolineae bacterium]